MKRRNIEKILASALTAVCLLSGCGSPAAPIEADVMEDQVQESIPKVEAGTDEKTGSGELSADVPRLTYFVDSLGDSNITSYNENVMYAEVEEILGIDIEFQHSTKGQFGEQLGVMIASSDLPDMIEGFSYAKGPEAAIEDGLILPLNDLVDKYAPDFRALLDSNPEIERQVLTDDGTIWAIPCLQPKKEPAWRGFSIRKDLLEEAGLEVPETLGELEEACLKFKEMGVETPFSMGMSYTQNNTPFGEDGAIVAAFGIGPAWYRDPQTDKVEFGPLQDEYRRFLEAMNRWYEEGILDSEFNSRKGEDLNTMIVNGDVAVFYMGYGPTRNMQQNGEAANQDFLLEQFPNLPLKEGEVAQMKNADPMNKGNDTVITTSCTDPGDAMRFLNFGFTEKGSMMYNYGLEGVSYEMVDGEPQFMEHITDGSEGAWPQIREKYKKHTGPYNRDWEAFPITEFESHCMEMWDQAGTDLILPKKMTRTAQENETFNPLMNDINVYLDENITNFINGTRSLDEFDAFRQELRDMGIEEANAIQQTAYERYMNR